MSVEGSGLADIHRLSEPEIECKQGTNDNGAGFELKQSNWKTLSYSRYDFKEDPTGLENRQDFYRSVSFAFVLNFLCRDVWHLNILIPDKIANLARRYRKRREQG